MRIALVVASKSCLKNKMTKTKTDSETEMKGMVAEMKGWGDGGNGEEENSQ